MNDSLALRQGLKKLGWRALAANGVVLVVLLGLFAYWMGDPWLFVATLTLFSLGLLVALNPRVFHLFSAAFAAYLTFALWAFLALFQFWAAFGVGRFVTERRSELLQAAVLIAWGCILLPLLFVIFTSERRAWLFSKLQRLGGLAPYVYAGNVLLLAMLFFGTLTTILQDQGALSLVGPRAQVYDFFLWHTLDSVPGLKVNETLRWDVPMTYQQGRVGLLVLLYKAVVLAPVVAAFVGYRRHVVAQAERRRTAVHEITVTSLDGREHRMEEYTGRVLLIVNVASECGYTPQYAGLEALYQRLQDRGFLVLGFPCNQFGAQEPGTNEEIRNFCSSTYGVTFPMFAKVDVNGAAAHLLFQCLKTAQPGLLGTQAIKWNFTKFLVNQAGQVVKRYGPATTPDAIEQDVQAHLSSSQLT